MSAPASSWRGPLEVLVITVGLVVSPELVRAADCVVLLHGLLRSSASMQALETALTRAGYVVSNVDYPSRDHPIETLSEMAVGDGVASCRQRSARRISFVTHSLGGILVRVYARKHALTELHRVVMLGPPNQGSEVVDRLKDTPGFELLNGPAGMQLGTADADVPKSLGPVDFELGVIAGTRSINLILSTLLPDQDDGKVSVEATKVDGMKDFIPLPVTHPLMMTDDAVIQQVLVFLQHGRFDDAALDAE